MLVIAAGAGAAYFVAVAALQTAFFCQTRRAIAMTVLSPSAYASALPSFSSSVPVTTGVIVFRSGIGPPVSPV